MLALERIVSESADDRPVAHVATARRVIETVRGYVFRPDVGARPLPIAPTVEALRIAFKVRQTSLLWAGQRSLTSGVPNEPTVLMNAFKTEPFLDQLERGVWWAPRRGLALRLYGVLWPDDTLALWTVPQPCAPSWPVPTAAELAALHERARTAERFVAAA